MGNSVIGPDTCGAMPTMFARTDASSVSGRRRLTITALAMADMVPSRMAATMSRPTRRLGMSPPEKDDPAGKGDRGRQAGVDKEERAQAALGPGAGEGDPQERRRDDGYQDAEDPGREEGTGDVDERIARGTRERERD